MKRDFELKKIKSILNNIIDNSSLKVGLNNVKIQSVWKKMMGSNINSYTSDISLKKRTLYVKLSSSVLREELSYGKEKIIKILNEEFGEVIIFVESENLFRIYVYYLTYYPKVDNTDVVIFTNIKRLIDTRNAIINTYNKGCCN